MNKSPTNNLMGEVKKYFLNQFHDLENQFKKGLCRNGDLAGIKLILQKAGDWESVYFLNFFSKKLSFTREFLAFL
jgi:ATP-dependent DNA ligase